MSLSSLAPPFKNPRSAPDDDVFCGENVHDRRHHPMSHAPHDVSYGPQLYIPAGCSGERVA